MSIPGGEPEDDELDQLLRESLGRQPRPSGSCPAAEKLTAFYRHELSQAEADGVAKHVAECAVCEACLAMLERMDEPSTDIPMEGLDEADRNVAAAVGAFLETQDQGPPVLSPSRRPWYRLLWHPAPAYVLAAGLGLVVLMGWRPDAVTNTPGTTGSKSLPGLVLDVTRSASSESALGFEGDRFFLSFQVPIHDGKTYRATIRSMAGSKIVELDEIRSYDEAGSFLLVLDRSLFVPGQYRLTVEEAAASPTEQASFTFDFTL